MNTILLNIVNFEPRNLIFCQHQLSYITFIIIYWII